MQTVIKKYKKLIVVLGVFSVLLVGVFVGGKFFFEGKIDRIIQDKKEVEILLKASLKIQKLWKEGDVKGLWIQRKLDCMEELGSPRNIDSTYLQCNPNFLQCYLENIDNGLLPPIKINEKNKEYIVSVSKEFKPSIFRINSKRYYKVVTKNNSENIDSPHYSIILDIFLTNNPSNKLRIYLEDSCADTYLPQRVYAYGPYSKNRYVKDWRWDNFNREIFVDRFKVTYRDLAEWIDYSGLDLRGKIKVPKEKSLWAKAAVDVLPKYMREYCAFKGKHILSSHVFDAATFHPGDYDKKRLSKVPRGPYPWTRKKYDSFLYKARRDKNFAFKDSFCKKVFTKECIGRVPFIQHSTNSGSWIGIFQVMGGYLEHMRNVVHPSKNVFVSSFYFSFRSAWHELGRRIFWDGEDFKYKNFKWEGYVDEFGSYRVGFRCMRYR